jgi:hypothetical protein
MVIVARIFLVFFLISFTLIGLSGLVQPDKLAANFDVLPQTTKGFAELRGIYGGVFLSWSVMIVAFLLKKPWANGLLLAVGISMACLSVVRLVSLGIDGEAHFNIMAFVGEALAAVACWVLHKQQGSATIAVQAAE